MSISPCEYWPDGNFFELFLQRVSLFCLFGCDQELMMEIKWVGRYYTIVVNLDGTVGDLKNAIFEATHVQPQLQRVR
jgi:hypothetical protein